MLLAPRLDQGLIFLDQAQAQFGGEGDVAVLESLAAAAEDLFEVRRVAQHGLGAMLGFAADDFHRLAGEDELFEDLLFVGEGRAQIVDGAATG